MENLTLPEPAAGLWAAKRSIVHAIPPEMFRSNTPPHLGGGTILAARWKHRISTDIDVLLPGRNTLIDLLQDNDRNIVNQLGGTPEAVAAGRVKIAFEHGFLDISTFRPDPPYGQAIATVDGQLEKVLSSHQILCGKLERVDQLLVRDVFDVLTAADEDPAALAAAVGMVSQQRATFIESAWRKAAGMLADNFHDSIRGARHAVGTRLGPEAAAAFQAHRYTRLEIDLHGGTLSIRKTIGAGPPRTGDVRRPQGRQSTCPIRRGHPPQQQRPRHRTPGPRRHPDRRQRQQRTHNPRLREPLEHRHDQPARPDRFPTATADRSRAGASRDSR